MFFRDLGKFVVKHYKIIIVFWIILLLLSIPLMEKLSTVQSNQQSYSGISSESQTAQNIIAKEYPNSKSNGTSIIIVITSQNVLSNSVKNYTLSVSSQIQNSKLQYFSSIASIYSIYYDLINSTVPSLHQNERLAYSQISSNVTLVLQLFYGVPATYIYYWASYGSDPNKNYEVYNVVYTAINSNTTIPAMEKNESLGYLTAFYHAWNYSFHSSFTGSVLQREQWAINSSAPNFINVLPVSTEIKQFTNETVFFFSVETWTNSTLQNRYSVENTLNNVQAMTHFPYWFINDVFYQSPSNFSEYSLSVIKDHSIAQYPIQIPRSQLSLLINENDTLMVINVQFDVSANYQTANGTNPTSLAVYRIRDVVHSNIAYLNSSDRVYVTGEPPFNTDLEKVINSNMAYIVPVSIIIIIAFMSILFRSPVTTSLPLVGIGIAIGIAQAMAFIIGFYVIKLDYTTLTILTTVLLGVGTDYSVFILSRYKEEILKGNSTESAMETSLTYAGKSVATSSGTVIISFGLMAISSYSFLRSMGLVVGLSVLVTLFIALTLVPSLALMLRKKVFWPISGKRLEQVRLKVLFSKANKSTFRKIGEFSVKRAPIILIIAVLISIPAAYVFLNTSTSNNFIGALPQNMNSVQGFNALSSGLGEGIFLPTQIVIVSSTPFYENHTFNIPAFMMIQNITMQIQTMSNVQAIEGPANPSGTMLNISSFNTFKGLLLMQILGCIGKDNKTAILNVILHQNPESQVSLNTVVNIRNYLSSLKSAQYQFYVGGDSASTLDTKNLIEAQFYQIDMYLVIGILVILFIVLGSYLLPLFAMVSIVLSIVWTMAFVLLFFKYFVIVPVLWITPIILFVMILGLGMDYDIFLLTRIREEYHNGFSQNEAIIKAIEKSGPTIVALGLILSGSLGAMYISQVPLLKEFGLALFLGVFIDALVVQTLIMPALMSVVGKRIWAGPKFLKRS